MRLSWKIENPPTTNDEVGRTQYRATPKYEQPMLTNLVLLAKQLRLRQNMTKEQIFDQVIWDKAQNIGVLNEVGVCSLGQVVSGHLSGTFSKLVSFGDDDKQMEGLVATDEDVKIGFELFQTIVYCPSMMDVKFFRFVDQLLSSESSRTIIQTFVNLFQSGVIKDAKRYEPAKEFYNIMASSLEMEFGNILMATSKKAQLQAVLDNDWPFLTNYTDLVKKPSRVLTLTKFGMSHKN